jgi:hypothetical protein
MNRFLSILFLSLLSVFISSSGLCSEDIGDTSGTVPLFFKRMEAEGLDGVERVVHKLYEEYDNKKTELPLLQNIAGIDLAAHLFLSNLDSHERSLLPKYKFWDQPSIVSRLDKRLKKYYKNPNERGELMLRWLKSTKVAMMNYYNKK